MGACVSACINEGGFALPPAESTQTTRPERWFSHLDGCLRFRVEKYLYSGHWGRGAVAAKIGIITVASVILAAAGVAGCSSQSTTIVGDDAALCQYSATEVGAEGLTQCQKRLASQNRRLAVANATRIDGYALLNTPQQPNDVAGRCKGPDAPKDCGAGDVTGTIPAQPKH